MKDKADELIRDYFAEEKWDEARKIIESELKKEPEDHWLLTRLSSTYYEQNDYSKALETSKKAYKISPNCPLVLWDYACALDMLKNEMEAIELWKKIISFGLEKVAHDECGEGVRWAKSIINDCRYRIASSYFDLKNYTKAKVFLEAHIKNRKRGQPSLYGLKEVKKKYKDTLIKL